MTKQPMYLLGVKVPAPIKEALKQKEASTGLSMSQQTREALMNYCGIKDVSKPYSPDNMCLPAKEDVVSSE